MGLKKTTSIGPYEILSPLGAGGMGEVYRARDTHLNRDVALKVLPQTVGTDPDLLARFRREAQLLACLNHPQIAQIYGFEEADGVPAIVMELVEGPTLADRIARGRVPLGEALSIARQIAEALEAAHEQRIIHRDLKPSNIKIRNDGKVKVLDFGLAKILERSSGGANSNANASTIVDPNLSSKGLILGTAAYMSPEQAAGKVADKRSDLWSFGVVLFEMLTGRPVFDGDTLPEVLASVLKAPPDWASLPTEVPATITTLLRRCLEKDAARRVDSATHARLVIEDAIETPIAVPTGRDTRRRRWSLAWLLPLVGLAMIAAAAVTYLRPTPGLVTRLDLSTPSSADPVSFALSPDGRQFVFVAGDGIESRLWLRPLDRTDAQPLAGTEGASYPFWAPTGRSIGFFANRKLRRFDVGGGMPQDVADAPTGRGGSWNQDNVIVFAPSIFSAIFRVAAGGGEAKAITTLAPEHPSHRFPNFLPDGRRFLYLTAAGPLASQSVFLGSIDGDAPKLLTTAETAAAYADPGYLLFVQEGALLARPVDLARGTVGEPITVADPAGSDSAVRRGAFSVSTNGALAYRSSSAARRQLVWLDRKGFQIGTIGGPDDGVPTNPTLAPNGRRIVLGRTVRGNSDIWIIENDRSLASRLTLEASNESVAVWSPDGQRIAFSSSRNGVFDIFERSVSGGDERPLLISPQPKTLVDWSQDGRFLLFSSADPKTGWDLRALSLTADSKPFGVAETPYSERNGQFSPDGHWVAFESNASGRYEVSVQAFPGPGPKWQVSSGGGATPHWRSDGRELFYVASDGAMMSASLLFSKDGRSLDVSDVKQLFHVPIVFGGAPRDNNKEQYAVTPDGQRFLVNVTSDQTNAPPVTVVLNWLSGLRR